MRDNSKQNTPRFLTDAEIRASFGLSERALRRLRLTDRFPGKDPLIGKTDRKAVDRFFDLRAGIIVGARIDGDENWGG